MLNACKLSLSVFPDDGDVHIGMPGGDAGMGEAETHIGK